MFGGNFYCKQKKSQKMTSLKTNIFNVFMMKQYSTAAEGPNFRGTTFVHMSRIVLGDLYIVDDIAGNGGGLRI